MRSGEHPEFSRLVFPITEQTEWVLGRDERGYTLWIEDPNLSWDISDIFRLMPKGRLRDVIRLDETFELRSDCACHANAFTLDGNKLVIDIIDGKPPQNSIFEQPLSIESPSVEAVVDETAQSTAHTMNDFPLSFTSTQTKELAMMERRLAESIGRAASQGLIEVEPKHLPTASKPTNTIEGIDLEEKKLPDRVSATTIVDLGVRELTEALAPAINTNCTADLAADIASWGTPDAIFDGIAEARSKLAGELDSPADGSRIQLAKAYLYAGFGAEAKASLAAISPKNQNTELLFAIADILDQGEIDTREVLYAQLSCDTYGAIWHALGGIAVKDTAAIKSEYFALPYHLRILLGPQLIEALNQANKRNTAAEIRNHLERTHDAPDDEFILSNARLLLAEDQKPQALSDLSRIYEGNTPSSTIALLELASQELQSGSPLAPKTMTALETLAFEQRGTNIDGAVTKLLVDAFSLEHEPRKAIRAIIDAREREAISRDENRELLSKTIINANKELNDADFISFAYEIEPLFQSEDISPPARQNTSERLLNSGLPRLAQIALGESSAQDAWSATLIARAANMENNSEEALKLTAIFPQNRAATEARLDAALKLEDHILAERERARLGENPKENPALSSFPEPIDLALANTDRSIVLQPTINSESLLAARKLINKSREYRSNVAELLNSMTAPN
ncbi:hypothetical protein ACFE33_15020 [Falsihalocynthiibacter sp. SS001]|uniref:hypothetical protein n=1 Tax=Falsihalocynthiibacter sp. SS001 TaxID=3349698 RepID=UPI0036D3F042